MIEIKEASKKFGNTQAVKSISFEVQDHENLVLLGSSGCGKTTTLKMINRLIEPDAGRILIDGKDITEENPEILRRRIGYVMQNIGLFPHYTVAENIAVVPKLLKWDKERTNERIYELIEKLHLPLNCLSMFPHELSGGQQQRVGLARALVTDPSILLMDEPFGALDNVTRSSIQAEFKVLEELKRKTILMVTHDVQEAFELADRICLIDKGEVVQIGTPKELLYKPATDFVKKFLDGQRLALEFKTVALMDLWEFLPDYDASAGQNDISENTSVWMALELLRSSVSELQVRCSLTGKQKQLRFQELIKAFDQYQNKQYHE